jgi:nucleoid-associated protein YgaU
MAAIVCPSSRTASFPARGPLVPLRSPLRGAVRAQGLVLPARPPARRQPSVTVRRRRAALALVAFAAIGALLGAGSLAGAGQAAAERNALPDPAVAVPVAATVHVVQPGDTLWTLARRLQPEGDVRPLVARLRAEHGPGPLVPGQRLRLAV